MQGEPGEHFFIVQSGKVNVMRCALEVAHHGWGESCVIGVAAAVKEMGTKHKFPYVSPSCLSWDPAMVACLANLSTWALLEAAHTISPWLSGGPAAV